MTATVSFPVCTCGDPQSQHKGRKDGCRNCDIGCARYVEDADATEKARAEFLGEQQADAAQVVTAIIADSPAANVVPTPEERESAREMAAAIARGRAEKERDEALAEIDRLTREVDGEVAGVRESLAERQSKVEDLEATLAVRTGQLKASREMVEQRDARIDALQIQLTDATNRADGLESDVRDQIDYADHLLRERDEARAELASAQAELQALRNNPPALAWGDQIGAALRIALPPAEPEVIGSDDGWICLSPYWHNGEPLDCGFVFTPGDEPETDHPCGELTPITITVTRREVGTDG